uniref:Uncharacterized protein n=1 Tax=Clastoptera arizonana TaxID=38151 RepID=A0A1B6CPC7_9HEMI
MSVRFMFLWACALSYTYKTHTSTATQVIKNEPTEQIATEEGTKYQLMEEKYCDLISYNMFLQGTINQILMENRTIPIVERSRMIINFIELEISNLQMYQDIFKARGFKENDKVCKMVNCVMDVILSNVADGFKKLFISKKLNKTKALLKEIKYVRKYLREHCNSIFVHKRPYGFPDEDVSEEKSVVSKSKKRDFTTSEENIVRNFMA